MDSQKTMTDFITEHGRVPMFSKGEKPWEYRGWLLWYVQMAQEAHPECVDRWSYLSRTIEAGAFLEEPIPQIQFEHSKDYTVVEKWLQPLQRHGHWRSFEVLVDFLGFGLGTEKEPPRMDTEEGEELYKLVDLSQWLLHPSDHLGTYLAIDRAKGWNPNAFYPTPDGVCEMMAQLTFHDAAKTAEETGRDLRSFSVNDPCMGTGRFLLHASNYSMNLSGQDIDHFVLKISKINAALYAPWLLVKPPFLK